jgi:tetratricopeptide (TPR) repeat protein/tRNA A-37 threonylcarbamoyl transferase component Bud32
MSRNSLATFLLVSSLAAVWPLASRAGDRPLDKEKIAYITQEVGAALRALPDSYFQPGQKDSYIEARMRNVGGYYSIKNRWGEYPTAPTDDQVAGLVKFYAQRLELMALQDEQRQNKARKVSDSPELLSDLARLNQIYVQNEEVLGPDLDQAFSAPHNKRESKAAAAWAENAPAFQPESAGTHANGDAEHRLQNFGNDLVARSAAAVADVLPARTDGATENGADLSPAAPTGPGTLKLNDETGVILPPAYPPYFHATSNLQQGRYADAVGDFKKSLAINPKNAEAASGLTSAYYEQNQYEDAVAAAQRALELNPKDRNALSVLQFSKGRVAGGAPSAPGVPGGDAAGAKASGGASAAGGFRAPAAAAPPVSSAQARAAVEAAISVKDYAAARSAVERALAAYPNDPLLYAQKAQIELAQRDYAGAAAAARAGLALAPRNPDLLDVLGLAQLRSGDYKGAVATANDLIELNPQDAGAFALRAHAYGNLGDHELMMADLDRAAQLDPRYREADARMAGRTQLPSSDDVLFLFPGEEGASPKPAAAPGSRTTRFWLIVGASAGGGLLAAFALLGTVLAPYRRQAQSLFTKLTRSGPRTSVEIDPTTGLPAAPAEPVPMPGLIRDRYELGRKIGAGGMGEVFEGFDRSLKRRVAVKKMRPELRSDPREKARFVAEAKTVAALHHDNIVDIYAIAEDGDDVFLVFEHVDGRTVHELVQTSGKLEPKLAARIARASADALEFAHARGVIHRDMKPSNVMVDGEGRVKVMDFGIARTAKDAAHRFSVTAVVVGTPPYMAPEQEQGQVRRESDAYSLAVCAYEMLTGRLPFAGTGSAMLLNKINMNYVPPSQGAAGLPAALDPVFARAFRAFPEERYRTPAEFASALESALTAPVSA